MRWIIILVLILVVASLVMDDPEHALGTLLEDVRTFSDGW